MPLALQDLVSGPQTDARLGKHLLIEPAIETGRRQRFPSQAVVVTGAARRMIDLSKAGEKLNSVVVGGKIDPTEHPEFKAISENLRDLRAKWFPRAKLWLDSTAPHLESADVRVALSCYGHTVVRLEAGTQKTFTAMTGLPGKRFKDVVDGLSRLGLTKLQIQACFVRGGIDNSTESEVKAWLKYVAAIQPNSVQIFTLEKANAANKTKPISKTRLNEIAEKIAEKMSLTPEVLGA